MDVFSVEKRSEVMSRIRGKNTKPEMTVRSLTYAMGYRYRLHGGQLPGTPDMVFSGRRKVIFINGCFWHGHKHCKKFKLPKSNAKFWRDKIWANRARDKRDILALGQKGWEVLTVWECELRDLDALASRISSFLEA